jgi:LMBR1 domain-containing protein 1
MSFVGWFLFVLFAGVGLSALPIDLLVAFKNRPIKRSSKEMAEKKSLLKK